MLLESIQKRHSIRRYQNKDVENGIIAELIESARLAPSGSNTQPWHFIIVKDPEKKEEITNVAHHQKWMLSAPVFIICVADISVRISNSEPYLSENCPLEELKQIIRDTSIAIEHIVIQASSIGLGTCWVSWFQQEEIRPVLGIPDNKYVVTILTLGYPDEQPAARPRKQMNEFLHYEYW